MGPFTLGFDSGIDSAVFVLRVEEQNRKHKEGTDLHLKNCLMV